MMNVSTLLVICTVAFVNINGGNSIEDGIKADWRKYCYMASIWRKHDNTYKYVCCGAIISPNHILTAAHCVFEHVPEHIYVVTGTSNIANVNLDDYESQSQSAPQCCITFSRNDCLRINKVSQVLPHPKYVKTKGGFADPTRRAYSAHDIAVIVVTCSIPIHCCHRQIRLPTQDIKSSTSCNAAGWGISNFYSASRKPNPILTYAIYEPEISDGPGSNDDDNEFRAHPAVGWLLPGDSGSPLVCDDTVIGILNIGFAGFPATFSNIYLERQFIMSAMENN